MKSIIKIIAGILSLAAFNSKLIAQSTLLKNVTVIDVISGKAIPGQYVYLDEGSIKAIGRAKDVNLNPADKIIDGTGKFLMPGLIDAHIHFFQSGGLYTRPDVVDFRKKVPYEKEKTFGFSNAADYMHRYLRLGITTVIDVGGPFANFIIRDSIAKKTIAPNVLVTGDDAPILKITTTQQADLLFAKMLPYKPDFIKIWYIASPDLPAEKNFPLVKYIAEQTHAHNLKLTVHSTELKTAELAVDAGADILVHSIDDEIIPDAFVKKLKDKKISYIPTLIVGTNYYKSLGGKLPFHKQDLYWANPFAYGSLTDMESMNERLIPAGIKYLRKNPIPASTFLADSISAINLLKLQKAGVNIVSGTDAGNISTMHASSYIQELEAMQHAGLTNAEILKASTINAALAFGKENLWGTVSKGKIADLLLLDKNPLESIQHLNAIHAVFKNGKLLQLDSIIIETPEAIVQRQLNAYNARDIDAFLDTYAEDVELYDYDDKKTTKGKERMKENYSRMFLNVKNLYCEIENRIVMGNKVIDKEKVRAGNQTIYAVAIYEVEKGKIKKVTFLR